MFYGHTVNLLSLKKWVVIEVSRPTFCNAKMQVEIITVYFCQLKCCWWIHSCFCWHAQKADISDVEMIFFWWQNALISGGIMLLFLLAKVFGISSQCCGFGFWTKSGSGQISWSTAHQSYKWFQSLIMDPGQEIPGKFWLEIPSGSGEN